jgi:hypothetical protein
VRTVADDEASPVVARCSHSAGTAVARLFSVAAAASSFVASGPLEDPLAVGLACSGVTARSREGAVSSNPIPSPLCRIDDRSDA